MLCMIMGIILYTCHAHMCNVLQRLLLLQILLKLPSLSTELSMVSWNNYFTTQCCTYCLPSYLVVDCGFVKLRAFSPQSCLGMSHLSFFLSHFFICPVLLLLLTSFSCPECLVVVPISQSSAKQRAGRAGRVRSGKAYRLYTGT